MINHWRIGPLNIGLMECGPTPAVNVYRTTNGTLCFYVAAFRRQLIFCMG